MGQITIPTQVDIFLTDVDRLTVSNSAAGMSPNAEHVIALGENAALNLGDADFIIALGPQAAANLGNLSQIIAIGASALDAGLSTANANGTIAIGGDALGSLTGVTQADGSNVAIGRHAGALVVDLSRSVLMGTQVFQNVTSSVNVSDNTVAIGYRAASLQNPELTAGAAFVRDSVLIGYEAGRRNNGVGTNEGTTLDDSVMIGHQAGLNYFLSGSSNRESAVIIGQGAGQDGYGQRDVIIGKNALTTTTLSGAAGFNVLIGADSGLTGVNAAGNVVLGYDAAHAGSESVVIGSLARGGLGVGNVRLGYSCGDVNTATGQGNILLGARARVGTGTGSQCDRNIVIGYGAGWGLSNSTDDMLIIESQGGGTSGTLRRMFHGSLATGNIIIGNTPDADLNWRGTTQPTNAVKLINGTVGTGANPSNGGFFYVSAGVLHWFDQGGRDMSLSVPVAGQLASTTTGYTNGAGAAAGTLANAPAAGNPTKWIPVNDNGTVRYIPAW